MIVIIKKKLLKTAILIGLGAFFGFTIYSYIQNMELASKVEPLICIASQLDKANQTTFLASANFLVQGHRNIEIFDIIKGEVIKNVKSNPAIQKEVENYLKGITGMYVKVKAFPDKGYIIRIPLEPAIMVKNHWLNDYGVDFVDEVFILFPEQGKHYLLVLDSQYRPLFYNFNGNTEVLLKDLSFIP